MRAHGMVLVALALLGGVMVVQGSPLGGGGAMPVKASGGETQRITAKFKGGERACVIVIGDHKPVVPLQLKVEDGSGNLIGEDKNGGDFCAVIWYPPRDGEYKIGIAVPSIGGEADFNDLYVSLK
jgi:hypothetical protein